MAGGIKIPVEASLDDSGAQKKLDEFAQKLNQLQDLVAKTSNIKISPISVKTQAEMQKMIAQFQILTKLSSGLSKRMAVTGQAGVPFTSVDFNRLYPGSPGTRDREITRILSALTGRKYERENPAAGRPRRSGSDDSDFEDRRLRNRERDREIARDRYGWGQQGRNVLGAGLGALGPLGGIANNAMNAGQRGGLSAGAMGLLGGLAAFGIGKAISGVMEKVDVAISNATNLDTLKRTVGDVNVNFSKLKAELGNTASDLKMTYSETNALAKSFANLSNITDREMSQLPTEVYTSGAFSRSFGMDPSSGVGFFGQMRGMRYSQSDGETRKLAILMGETISKSGAFSQADRVLSSIAQFTARQQAATLGRANIEGYAGWYSAAISTGRQGLSPDEASNMLSRVDMTLSQGGGKGEASQFFGSFIGRKLGLNPFQMNMLNEGGAFATPAQIFGPGSMAARSGISVPGSATSGADANKTLLQLHAEELRRSYGNMPKEFAINAMSNHFGISSAQAMALYDLKPDQMGELGAYIGDNYKNMNPTAISSISRVVSGTTADRQSIISNLAGRRNADGSATLSSEELAQIGRAAKDPDSAETKKMLATILAKYGQEETEGSIARDSKNLLDNIKTSLADKLVPLTNDIRLGIMHIAGNGKKSPDEILREITDLETEGKIKGIQARYAPEIEAARANYLSKPLSAPLTPGATAEQIEQENKERKEAFDKLIALEKKAADEIAGVRAKADADFKARMAAETAVSDAPAPSAGLSYNSVVQSDGPIAGGYNVDGTAHPGGYTASSSDTIGIRHNNPGNLVYAGQRGAQKVKGSIFANFPDKHDGLRANARQLLMYYHGKSPVAKAKGYDKVQNINDLVDLWAPLGHGTNDPEGYKRMLSENLKVGAHDDLRLDKQENLYALMREVSKVENKGRFPYSPEEVYTAINDAGVTGTSIPDKDITASNKAAAQSVHGTFDPVMIKLMDQNNKPIAAPVSVSPKFGKATSFGI